MSPALLLWLGAAFAADPEIPHMDANLFEPAIDSRSTYQVEESGRYDRARGIGRLLLGYAHDPLVAESSDGERVDILRTMVTIDAIGGYDFGVARIALRVPMFYAAGDIGSGGGLGDLALDLRLTPVSRDKFPVGLAFAGAIMAPTTTVKDLPVGRDGVGWSARAILDGEIGPALLALNVGVAGQPVSHLDNASWGTQVVTRGGATFAVKPQFDLSAELSALIDVTRGVKLDSTPVEAGIGGTVHTGRGVGVRIGAMAGLTPGVGDPVARVLIGLDYEKVVPRDSDGDGITDDHDGCPREPEDMDGFEDTDGCPDASVEVSVHFVDENHQPVGDVVSSLDGALASPTEWMVNPGSHTLHATANGFLPLEESLVVPEAGLAGMERIMHHDPAFGFGTVLVHVHSEDGKALDANWSTDQGQGAFPHGEGRLTMSPGKHFVKVEAAGYGSARLAVDIVGGGEQTLEISLAPPKVTVKEDFVSLDGAVYFATNTAILEDRSKPLLSELAQTIIDHPELLRVRIEGHTDSRGSDDYNQRLSDARAKSVADYLIGAGVAAMRLDSIGYGEKRPIDSGNTEVAWSVNRRVEVRILERAPRQ